MRIDGLKIVEYGLKTILLLLDLAFFLFFIFCMAWTVMEIKRKIRERKNPPPIRQKPYGLLFFVLGIFCGLLSVVSSGLVLMHWWT